MLVLIARVGLGTIFTPTLDYASGKDVDLLDIVPFGNISSDQYSMWHFVQDVGHSASGALFAASPYFGQVIGAEVIAGGSVTAGTAAFATGALGVAGIAVAAIYTAHLINELEPGTEEYSTMSSMAWNLNMSAR
jgi:hypothetical protein